MESFNRYMEICYSSDPYPGFVKFRYQRFFRDRPISDTFIYCRNKADFLSLLFYWSGLNWQYKPALDKYGYILEGR